MYVLCVGMYRACSTWQYEVASHLLERHRSARRLGYVPGAAFREMERAGGPGRGWAILKSHDEDPRFLPALEQGRALVLYAYRDLRDVAFSLAHKRGTTLEGIVRQGMLHQILANDRCWTAQPRERRLSQRYESLLDNPAGGVRELAAFLGIRLASGEAEAVAAEYSLEANRQRTRELGRKLVEQGVDLTDPTNVQRCDNHTLLHWNHVRDGRIGGWREQARPRQRALLARFCGRWLIERGYEDDLAWAGPAGNPLRRISGELAVARSWWTYQAARQSRLRPGLARMLRGAPPEAAAPHAGRPHAPAPAKSREGQAAP
ncbi:MAG: sulfotransferase domain-containing protein [Isosphaeraceae bacterium]